MYSYLKATYDFSECLPDNGLHLAATGTARARQLAKQRGAVDNPRAMLLMCYQHDEPPVKVPRGALKSGGPVMEAFSAAHKAGVEFWQVHPCRQRSPSHQ